MAEEEACHHPVARRAVLPGAGERCGICGATTTRTIDLTAEPAAPSEGASHRTGATLTFAALRAANLRRLPQFKNRRGEPAHSEPDGSDWKLSAWCNAVTGELGEAANLIKKIERGDLTLDEARSDLGRELADVQTYLDILAFRAGVDLGAATIQKWNEVSERVGSDTRLGGIVLLRPTHPVALAVPAEGL